ncbi:flagellar biosynthetic protein FliO [Allobacillus sp. GCM10007491]|uniref:Flagellar biosynthetic protein FliO n=1 Tax=Allobacillus saliphilus TaxID=2912308 RepID=A0A941CVD0_9BACI|nr:flagellar biosynthetic protein FliO [Allobacillus saliphilus]MBR7552900.1 flagellar biosynthetic protein FliO [Allobacillus saliphilus]
MNVHNGLKEIYENILRLGSMKMKQKIAIGVLLFFLIIPFGSVSASPSGEGNVSDLFDEEETNQQEEPVQENNNDNEDSAGKQVAASDRSLFLDFLKMIVALVVVLGLIYFLLKFLQKRTRIYQQTRSLENFGGLSLGSNKSIQIVRVGNDYYLIGVGDNIQLLDKIDSPETIDSLESSGTTSNQAIQFQDLLKRFTQRDQNPYQKTDIKNDFQSELSQMKKNRSELLKGSEMKEDQRHD